MHDVSRSVRLRSLAAALLCGLTLAGCAGQVDLSKSVANRKTVKAGGGYGAEALRAVDPCGLLPDTLLNSVGKKGTSGPAFRDYSECDVSIKDSSNKVPVTISLKIGEALFSPPKQTSTQINGLPTFPDQSSTSCAHTAITGREPDRGIVARVIYDGGDPCKIAVKVLEATVKMIAENPPKFPPTPGSLVTLDPCAAFKDDVVNGLVGEATAKEPYGLHTCHYQGKDVNLNVRYAIDIDPMTGNVSEHPVEVDLAPGIKAAQWKSSSGQAKCQVEWVHRQISGPNRGENVNVSWERSPAQVGEDPCAKALAAAKALAPTLKKS